MVLIFRFCISNTRKFELLALIYILKPYFIAKSTEFCPVHNFKNNFYLKIIKNLVVLKQVEVYQTYLTTKQKALCTDIFEELFDVFVV